MSEGSDPKLQEFLNKIAGSDSCTACRMDYLIATNRCPERVETPFIKIEDTTANSPTNRCRLPWHHKGRCEPLTIGELETILLSTDITGL